MTQQTCETCQWWGIVRGHLKRPDRVRRCGQCRLRAPFGDWPITEPDDWCGEHQPRDEKAARSAALDELTRVSEELGLYDDQPRQEGE